MYFPTYELKRGLWLSIPFEEVPTYLVIAYLGSNVTAGGEMRFVIDLSCCLLYLSWLEIEIVPSFLPWGCYTLWITPLVVVVLLSLTYAEGGLGPFLAFRKFKNKFSTPLETPQNRYVSPLQLPLEKHPEYSSHTSHCTNINSLDNNDKPQKHQAPIKKYAEASRNQRVEDPGAFQGRF